MFEKIKMKQQTKRIENIKARERDIQKRMDTDPEFKKYIEEKLQREKEYKDSFSRKPHAIEFQKNIMNNLICPLCNNDKFITKSLSQSKDSIDYKWTIESLKICRRCGFIIRYYDFDRDNFDTNNFDEENGSVYLNEVRHS